MNPKLLTAIVLPFLYFCHSCGRQPFLPVLGSREYQELCSAFYLGLAALQSGEDVNARKGLTRATEIAPGEPAGWTNLGLLELRQQEYDAAYITFEKARTLVPDNSEIEAFLGLVESRRGKIRETLDHYQRAVSLDSSNLRALYSLAVETERQQTATSDTDALKLLDQILKLRPQSEPVLLDIVRLAAKQNAPARLQEAVGVLSKSTDQWPESAKQYFALLRDSASKGDLRNAAINAQFLRNTLVRVLSYRRSLEEIRAPASSAGDPFLKFLKLPSPTSEPARPDMQVRFEPQPFSSGGSSGVRWIGAIPLNDDGSTTVLWADNRAVHLQDGATLPLPGSRSTLLGSNAIAGLDLNYDFKTDLVIATADGVRIYQQDTPRRFLDVNAKTKVPGAILRGSYTGVWALDFDLDGDLDVTLGTPQGEPVVLRNNGDGTFETVRPFQGVDGMTSFTNADIDADGVPDVALIDRNKRLIVFRNERLGSYKRRNVSQQAMDDNLAVTAGDVDGDGLVDFVLLRSDFRIARLSDRDYGSAWQFAEIAQGTRSTGPVTLLLADLDNNGALDIIAANQVFLSDGKRFMPAVNGLPFHCAAVADLNGDGRLDGIGLTEDQKPFQAINHGTANYKWQVIRTRAATVMGDQRMNSFGIGGEIEIRSGLLTQKQTIQSPVLHFGLGDHPGSEFARIVWPNGIIQTEFELKAEQSVLAQQRLKGSCPFLFTWDGQRMRFLKDVGPMSAALGAHLDARTLEPIHQTEQWFKINGDHFAPRDGYYDLRLTNEYWETYYIDHYSLTAVDHPRDSEIFVDERVAVPPAPLKIYVTSVPRPFASAKDDMGRDVGATVGELDARYLDGFGVGQYQGLTRDHWVELELPEDAPRKGPLYLIGNGFLHPWDDTITIARSQATRDQVQDLRIEVPDESGNWRIVQEHLGIPAGRLKTVVLDLSRVFHPRAARKLRLRTNMEIYWDRLAWASGAPNQTFNTQRLNLSATDLRFRGYSLITQEGPVAPELAHYDTIVRTGQQWRSLEGYYTRYGDVGALLEQVDNRIVIMNSGDELRMRFKVADPPPSGWTRDFVFVTDGWLKEGDYNFRFSKTVQPLPYRGMRNYTIPLGPLEEEKTYQLHPMDWQDFHTRYVTLEPFARALWKR